MLQYPKVCREDVTIHLIQSREHILNTVSPFLVLAPLKHDLLRESPVLGSNLEICRGKRETVFLRFKVLDTCVAQQAKFKRDDVDLITNARYVKHFRLSSFFLFLRIRRKTFTGDQPQSQRNPKRRRHLYDQRL